MSREKQENTAAEMAVRRLLHSLGFRYSLHRKDLPGKLDIVMRKYKLCIFVNGCFWHHHLKCARASIPTTNTEYWIRSSGATDNATGLPLRN